MLYPSRISGILIIASMVLTMTAGNTTAGDQPYYIEGTTLYEYITPAQPVKGESYDDPAFGTSITRITDHAADLPGSNSARIGYGTWNPLSSDGRYLCLMIGRGAGYGIWKAKTPYNFYKKLERSLQSWNGQDPEPRWDLSGNHPTWLYYRKDMTLRRIDVETNQDVLVHDFAVDFPTYASSYYIWNGEEGNSSADSRYWPFMLGKSNTNIPLIFVYDMVLDKVVSTRRITNGSAPNNVMMSPSGKFIYVAYSPVSPYTGDMNNPGIYTRDFATFRQSSAGVPHATWVYSKQGHEGILNLWPSGINVDYLTFTRADNGHHYRLYYQGDMGWNANLLFAYGSSHKPGWGFLSTYDTYRPGDWANNQLFAIEVDETRVHSNDTHYTGNKPRIWRIAFTQNFVDLKNYYFQQPNAAISADGTRIWWGSNWAKASNQRQDVLQANLPVNWLEDLQKMKQKPQSKSKLRLKAKKPSENFTIRLSMSSP